MAHTEVKLLDFIHAVTAAGGIAVRNHLVDHCMYTVRHLEPDQIENVLEPHLHVSAQPIDVAQSP